MNRFEKLYVQLIPLLFLIITPSIGFCWTAKVVSVTDGDTITVLHGDRQVKIRLYGIDTPEKSQDFGQKAKDLTSALVAGRSVEVEQKDVDRYGRVVGLVKVDGQNLNELIILNGFAWVYRQYCKERFCSDWLKLEETAQQQKKGMWSDPNIIPPWEWRQHKKKARVEEEHVPVIFIGENKLGEGRSVDNNYRCDGRTHCSQMTSCQEARFFLMNCPGTKMDGDNDGVPCEKQWCN
jgi:endonuclease YncB( thermonuclease family)